VSGPLALEQNGAHSGGAPHQVLGDADKMHQQMGWPSRSWTLLAPAVICTTAAALLVSRISRSSSVSLRGWLRGWWWLRQRWLRTQLIERDLIDVGSVRLIGGADISFIKGSETDACAALVVVAADSLEVVHSVCRRVVLTSPYIPGYLAFREAPFLVSLLDELRRTAPHLLPEVILIDGNGILHPNRFGLACHLGVQTGIPTIGVGKSLHHVTASTRTECALYPSSATPVAIMPCSWVTLVRRGAHCFVRASLWRMRSGLSSSRSVMASPSTRRWRWCGAARVTASRSRCGRQTCARENGAA